MNIFSTHPPRTGAFFASVQRDLRLFLFMLALVCVYRVIFMAALSNFLASGTPVAEILLANFVGLRLSLKTAGWCAAFAFLFASVPVLIFPSREALFSRVRLAIGAIESLLFSVLFLARFPFYRAFHCTFNTQVMAGANDDLHSVFWMMVEEYGLVWRLLVALLLAAALTVALKKLLALRTLPLPRIFRDHPLRFAAAFLPAFAVFFLFVRFGGAFTYGGGVNWESAGITSDAFLNECILDDGQAMYRVRIMEQRMKDGAIAGVEKERVRDFARQAAGHADLASDDLTPYLERTAKGARIAKPRHIFIILGESWARWPELEKYAALGAVPGLESLAAAPNGYESAAFMPNGTFTSSAINGIITGLPEMGVRVNYQPRSLREVYPTALAPQMQRLGYHVDFWYGGVPSWDGMNRLALAQGFDHYYGYPDFHAPKQTTWGTNDDHLFDALYHHLAGEEPTVHVIMTVSNHPPYTIDIESLGFDLAREKELTRQMPDVDDPDQLALEVGHIWYMDKMATEFIKKTEAAYPDSLFILTGDHAVRTNPSNHPTLYEHDSVPLVIYGAGVTKDILPPNAIGGCTNLLPTLIELIAPAGFPYYSILPSMTEGTQTASFNSDVWVTDKAVGSTKNDATEPRPDINVPFDPDTERAKMKQWLPMARTLSWWLATHGTNLNGEEK